MEKKRVIRERNTREATHIYKYRKQKNRHERLSKKYSRYQQFHDRIPIRAT